MVGYVTHMYVQTHTQHIWTYIHIHKYTHKPLCNYSSEGDIFTINSWDEIIST